ncbi:MAG TPA: diguanylate cyclase [Gemmatimonadaceae bacterium]|jgi:diguanylate cyclase (GGDEF)-like protein|nr:diguanylate cyclase [Gemmatimonadaceae bacterium]
MSASIRVLLVQADDSQAGRLAEAVQGRTGTPLDIDRASEMTQALRRLSEDHFDAVLLSVDLPGPPVLEGLTRLHDHAPDVPILVLTDGDDEAQAMMALKLGAQDSIALEQVDGNLLVRAIRYAIERHQLQMALRAMSLVDDLTGLYNRRGFLTLARQQLKVADRMNKRVSQIFVDLDGLKAINDRHGHREGDLALLETADILKEIFREADIIARIGGDEFVVLALESSGARPESYVERLREKLAMRNARGQRPFVLSLSMGIAQYDPASPCSIDDLLAKADALMYAEKRSKRSRRPGDLPGAPPAMPTPYSAVHPRAD